MTDDERLLRDLGRLERERRADDQAGVPSFAEELCAGALPADEDGRLRDLAEDSREVRRALSIFQPLGSEFQARMLREFRAELGPRRLLRFPRVLRSRWIQLAAVAGTAAVILGLSWWLDVPGPRSVASLPSFVLRFEGIDDRRSPGTDSEVAVLSAGSPFLVTLVPESRVAGPVDVKFFVVGDGDWRPWPAPADIEETGAIRVDGRLQGELLLEPGLWTLVAAVGRPRALPSLAEIRARAPEGTPEKPRWRLYRKDFRVVPADD